jgi:hypothetical protein
MIHKLLMTSILAFFDDAWQLPGGMIIATIYLVILLVAMPYLREEVHIHIHYTHMHTHVCLICVCVNNNHRMMHYIY